MKKRFSALALALLMLALTLPAAAFGVQLSPQKLTVDGVEVACEKYNIDGSNFFKLRDIAYVLSDTDSRFSVGYDGAKNAVSITTGEPYTENGTELALGEDKSATAQRSAQTILINGVEATELSVYNIGGNNFFKLRDLGDALGFEVDYNGAINAAVVTSRGAPEPNTNTVNAWYKKGADANLESNWGVAAFWFGKAAAQGDASSQNSLGFLYERGLGVGQSYDKALEWYRKSADQGYGIAENNLGAYYMHGWGVAVSGTEALEWLKKAIAHDDPYVNAFAYYNLGQLYERGVRGVPQSSEKAAEYYQKSIDSGYADNVVNVWYYFGMMCLDGRGVQKDEALAVEYLRHAAELGNSPAQYLMGEFCEYGKYGVEKNLEEAMRWYRLAAAQGYQKAIDRVNKG